MRNDQTPAKGASADSQYAGNSPFPGEFRRLRVDIMWTDNWFLERRIDGKGQRKTAFSSQLSPFGFGVRLWHSAESRELIADS
jgi:hypothetical protein